MEKKESIEMDKDTLEVKKDPLEAETQRLIDICARLKRAKESLEIKGYCPEMYLIHEEDPYNIGFIWASLKNALHSATDSLNSIVACKEPGNLKDIIENSDILKPIDS